MNSGLERLKMETGTEITSDPRGIIDKTFTDEVQAKPGSWTRQSNKSNKQDDAKLCGYLNKYKVGSRALLRAFKTRWFIFAENRCKLVYYRTPQDLLPLGEIDIANGTFSFDAGNTDRLGLFQISSDGKTYFLEARDKCTRMYWLQELQKRRRQFSQRKTSVASEETASSNKLKLVISPPDDSTVNARSQFYDIDLPQVLSPVLPTDGTVGEATADQMSSGISHISITNLKTEVLNAVANIRSNRQSNSEYTSPLLSPFTSPEYTKEFPEATSRLKASSNQSFKLSSLSRKFRGRKNDDICDISSPKSNNNGAQCQKCHQLQQYVISLKDDLQSVEEELTAHREIVSLLQKQHDILQVEIKTRQTFKSDPKLMSDMNNLLQRDRRIVELEHLLAVTQEEKELVKSQAQELRGEVQSLKDEVSVFKEMMVAKDQIIISLSNRIYELEAAQGYNTNRSMSAGTNTTLRRVPDSKMIDQLRDELQAYQLQNRFLNKEILELNHLRRNDVEREKMLTMKCATLEAQYYQTQSKYLLLLKELQTPQREGADDNVTQDIVCQLLQDAIDSDERDRSGSTQQHTRKLGGPEFDCYGFQRAPREDDELIAKATDLQKRSEEITTKIQETDIVESSQVRWENFLMKIGKKELQRCVELKNLSRLGIPHEHKQRVWTACINFWVGKKREEKGPEFYQKLVETMQGTTKINPAAKQIELDLLRTLPTNQHYMDTDSLGVPKLRRVLLAYSQYNPVIQYCQGMNRLAALALLFLPEEDAFWCLVAIVDYIMPPDYYSKTLLASQADQRVLKDILAEKSPRLHFHLEQNGIDLTLFTFNWFLTVFVDNIPPETFIRIWDVFLYEGSKVLFRFAIAFLKIKEADLLKQPDQMALNKYLRGIGEQMTDVHRIVQVAFYELNPFRMKGIDGKRTNHLLQVKRELEELDLIRQEFITNSHTSVREEYLSDDD